MNIPFSYTKQFDTSLHTLEGAQNLFLKNITKLLEEAKDTRFLLEANIILSEAAQLKESGLTQFHANITVSPLDIKIGEVTQINSQAEVLSLVNSISIFNQQEEHLAFVRGVGPTEHKPPLNPYYGGFTQLLTLTVEHEIRRRDSIFGGLETQQRWIEEIILRRMSENYFQAQDITQTSLPIYQTYREKLPSIRGAVLN